MTLRRGMALALLLSVVLAGRGTAKDLERSAVEKLSLEKQIEAARELVLSNKRVEALKKLRAI
ncbi:MAG: hypothetical protein JNJ49_03610, partial [Bdellovibrionaceae bacterium]|nr:hypothetical protein [Pseudobdellovibrionaceae bacterium]